MSAHTPGPWVWGQNYRGLYGSGELHDVLTYVSYENMWLAEGSAKEANAHLIAAAPDLLEALQAWMKTHDDYGPDGGGFSLILKGRAAIAKATGK